MNRLGERQSFREVNMRPLNATARTGVPMPANDLRANPGRRRHLVDFVDVLASRESEIPIVGHDHLKLHVGGEVKGDAPNGKPCGFSAIETDTSQLSVIAGLETILKAQTAEAALDWQQERLGGLLRVATGQRLTSEVPG